MKYNLISNGDHSNITVFVDDEMYVADSTHPNFQGIIAKVVEGDESVVELFDVAKTVATRFENVSERVSVANGRVYFDGDEVNNSLTQQIIRFMDEGVENWKPLVKFYEHVAANPNGHSREQLFEWLSRRNFTITDDGHILAYKAVYANEDGTFRSSSSGTAVVNGVSQSGQIVQALGDVVEMPRSAVQHDPSVGCHTGLHVGSWDYASTFLGDSGTLLAVKVNPRDIVSVPTDCDAAKVRTCRYTLSHVVREPIASAVWEEDYAAWDEDDDEDVCMECGHYGLCCSTELCDGCLYGSDEDE